MWLRIQSTFAPFSGCYSSCCNKVACSPNIASKGAKYNYCKPMFTLSNNSTRPTSYLLCSHSINSLKKIYRRAGGVENFLGYICLIHGAKLQLGCESSEKIGVEINQLA